MQENTLTRRTFVKAATLAGAALAMGTQVAGSLGEADKAWAATPSETKMYVSTCHGCIQVCPCRVYVRDGIVVKLEGHPIAPVSLGSMCLKGFSQMHTVYSPRRVLYPLKRAGDRGAENATWERISWDAAIELAATKIAEAIEKYGTYAYFTSGGGGGGYSNGFIPNLANSMGSPTAFEPGAAQCYMPRQALGDLVYGAQNQSVADVSAIEMYKGLSPYEAAKGVTQDTKVLVLWGAQPSVSQVAQSGRAMAELRACGCKMVVVDPNMSPDAVKADAWLRVRPGSDGAMVLGWYRYIFENKLYDEKFVKDWTNLPFIIDPDTYLPLYASDIFPDFVQTTPENTPAYVCYDNKTKSLQPLEYASKDVDPEIFWKGDVKGKQCRTAGQIYKDTAEPWTLQKVEEICWVPPEITEKGIRIYTDVQVAGIGHGVSSDMEQIASQLPLGLMGLDVIMGYVNKPGATLTQNVRTAAAPGPVARPTQRVNGYSGSDGSRYDVGYVIGATKAQNASRIAALPPVPGVKSQQTVYLMSQMSLDRLGTKNYKGLNHWTHAHIPSVLEAIKTGIPYKPRVWFDVSGNKLAMLGNAGAWYDAFDQIDFCIAQHPMITSFQAEVADLIFPLEEWLETPIASRQQINYTFPQTQIIHLGETVPNSVPPQKVIRATAKILNDYLAAGNAITLGAIGAIMGPGPASPSQSSTSVDPKETETEKNSTSLHKVDETKFAMTFPLLGGFQGAVEEDSVLLQQVADRFKAPDYATLMSDLKYQQPDVNNLYDTTFVDDVNIFWAYDQHLAPAVDGLPKGFGTESRKCEVYASIFVKMSQTGFPYFYPYEHEPVDPIIGEEIKAINPSYEFVGKYSPVCQHVEPAESPIEGMPGYDPEYPLAMTSGRVYYYHHGTMRHAPFIRELYPVPDVRMHPDTAKKYGLKHMDWVKVTSKRGTTTGRVYETRGMHPKVLWMERFWNPECFDNSQTKKTGGWRECNVNVLTKSTPPYNEVFGSYTNRGFQVKIEKGERPAGIWVEPKEFEPFMPHNANQYVNGLGSALNMPQTPPVTFNDWTR